MEGLGYCEEPCQVNISSSRSIVQDFSGCLMRWAVQHEVLDHFFSLLA
jgi:hypothetical protein